MGITAALSSATVNPGGVEFADPNPLLLDMCSTLENCDQFSKYRGQTKFRGNA
jgi:hypothetical protein